MHFDSLKIHALQYISRKLMDFFCSFNGSNLFYCVYYFRCKFFILKKKHVLSCRSIFSYGTWSLSTLMLSMRGTWLCQQQFRALIKTQVLHGMYTCYTAVIFLPGSPASCTHKNLWGCTVSNYASPKNALKFRKK